MPADYLSRLPATTNEPIIAAFDPFQTDLAKIQMEEPFAQNILYYGKHNQWPPHLSKSGANYHANLLKKIFHNKEGILWVRLTHYKYHPNGITPTSQIPERSSLRSPPQHFRGS